MEIHKTGLIPHYKTYEHQRCFIGYSREASWRADIESACREVLQNEFNLEPYYADEHPDPTRTLRDKVVEMIANTRYGIYDLSYWQKDDKSEWMMPRNVFIELGIAIALNRPILLLRHAKNEEAGLKLPHCLESIQELIVVFSGKKTLKDALRERLPQWIHVSPEHDWWNRYCTFGNRICQYREAYPQTQYRRQHALCCHISDGQDKDRLDFRDVVESVLECYDDVTFTYLDNVSLAEGYNFLLCTYCQTVRSNPFAIYRIAPKTSAETFIALGMSLALEKQFEHKIPSILLAGDTRDVPSLLAGYEVCIGQNDVETKTSLQKFMPVVIQEVRKRIWKQKPLPFIEIVPWHYHKPAPRDDQETVAEKLPLPFDEEILQGEETVHNTILPIQEVDAKEVARCDRVIKQTTPHQLEVLRAFATGLNPKEVAAELKVSIKTVDTHKTMLLSLCREAWDINPNEPLSYHFLKSKFVNYFNYEKPLPELPPSTQGESQSSPETRAYLLSQIWPKLAADLRDVLVLAFNASQQDLTSGPIRTQHVFAALQNLPGTAQPLLARLPQEALPTPRIIARTLEEHELMSARPRLSGCVDECLERQVEQLEEGEQVHSLNFLVELLAAGTGSTISRLRQAGVTRERVSELLRSLNITHVKHYDIDNWPNDDLGSIFGMLRIRAKLPHHLLGSLVGVSETSIRNWEAGVSRPREETLRRLIEVHLLQGSFTSGHEHEEVKSLWEKAGLKTAFDEAWFSGLKTKEQHSSVMTEAQLIDQIAELYTSIGATIKHEVRIGNRSFDLVVSLNMPNGLTQKTVIETKSNIWHVNVDTVREFAAAVQQLRKRQQIDQCIMVSATGFSKAAATAAKEAGIDLFTSEELQIHVGQLSSMSG